MIGCGTSADAGGQERHAVRRDVVGEGPRAGVRITRRSDSFLPPGRSATPRRERKAPMTADSYTGDVTVGGPVDVRELPGLRVTKVAVGPFDNNAYVLRDPDSGETVLVDAAAEADRLLDAVGDGRLVRIVTTHQHPDHWGALEDVVRRT